MLPALAVCSNVISRHWHSLGKQTTAGGNTLSKWWNERELFETFYLLSVITVKKLPTKHTWGRLNKRHIGKCISVSCEAVPLQKSNALNAFLLECF